MRNNSYSSSAHRSGGKASYNGRPINRTQRRPAGQGTYIDPKRFVNKVVGEVKVQAMYESTNSFSDFDLHEKLQANIAAAGYTAPTAIQDGAIPPILEGKDLIGLANTGTGKTAAFLLPIITRLLAMPVGNSALIVAPTRELAQQIDEQFRIFANGSGLLSAICVGGAPIYRQIQTLSRKPDIIIGTPGRLKDLVNRKALSLSSTSIVVLDEADQMLDMGFINDIRFLINLLPNVKQSLCFSATITPEIERLVGTLLTNPVTISVRTSETSEHVEQDVVRADSKEHKFELLKELLYSEGFDKVLIFGQTKHGVQRLAENLSRQGFPAEAIHGNKSQPQRQRALQAFKRDVVRVLVATDVAARGLDIPNVSHVINFDQPNTYQDYVHRIGRTGRAGKKGKALTFIGRS